MYNITVSVPRRYSEVVLLVLTYSIEPAAHLEVCLEVGVALVAAARRLVVVRVVITRLVLGGAGLERGRGALEMPHDACARTVAAAHSATSAHASARPGLSRIVRPYR